MDGILDCEGLEFKPSGCCWLKCAGEECVGRMGTDVTECDMEEERGRSVPCAPYDCIGNGCEVVTGLCTRGTGTDAPMLSVGPCAGVSVDNDGDSIETSGVLPGVRPLDGRSAEWIPNPE